MDFQQQRGHFTVRVHGKGDKVRLIPVNDHVRAELHGYYARLARLGVKLAPDEWLLQTNPLKRRGQRLDGSTVYRLIEKYARELGINKKVSPHSCRATVISHLLDTQLTPIRDVAIFAGHANVTTTERYDKRRQNLEQSAAYQVDFAAKKKAAS
jgi:integrase